MTLSQKPATFAITWVVYASSYLLRKPLGIIKSDLQTNYNLTCNQLGWLGTSFHLPYALVQITLGNLGDKYGAPRVITASMIVASVLCSLLASGNPLSSLPPMAKLHEIPLRHVRGRQGGDHIWNLGHLHFRR